MSFRPTRLQRPVAGFVAEGDAFLLGRRAYEIFAASWPKVTDPYGSGGLAQTLMQHDLVDEYRLLTYPVVLGKGTRLFADGPKPVALKRIDRETTITGVSIDVYTPAGELTYGSVGPEYE